MKTADIREAFLSYFERQQHTRVASSSLVPHDDPTLLFTNAGMNQFKDTFLGVETRDYHRAVSSQRCVRAGGKHNDLENVGYTARHHTFFEMLGNFSFGDYFKREAINFAWTFLTEDLQLPKEKLWVTVHTSDDEAAKIWIDEIGVDANRLSRLDEDNFWQMGDTGPCGPSSEIFYDHGADVPGGPPGSPDDDLDRYIEIWNLVFMQYNRDSSGELHALPAPSVDTGMGLERIAAVLQGVHNNYDIDLFKALIAAAASELEVKDLSHTSLRVVADHLRACAFLVSDGVLPSNEGRGYVLRRILRRAIRHGNKLGATEPFFAKLVPALVAEMGPAYPELVNQQATIVKALAAEELQFARTLDKGMDILEDALSSLEGGLIPGDVVFRLYDTYGFPVDLTNDIARERGLELDLDGYQAAMQEQRKRSQESGAFQVDYNNVVTVDGETEFLGYRQTTVDATVRGLIVAGQSQQTASEGDEVTVVLDRTPFYAESGGQVGDTGCLVSPGAKLEVRDTTKAQGHHLHHARVVEGALDLESQVAATIDNSLRLRIKSNHSATHLMHEALRQVLGDHVQQKGSLVDADKLRFDFSHTEAVSSAELSQVAQIVNDQVRGNSEVLTQEMGMDDAVAAGATALFGEKYGDEVRVLTMGSERFSVELCGGTHVDRTGDIGLFRIVSEGGVAAGVRRIEAVTGVGALDSVAMADQALAEICEVVKASPSNAAGKVVGLRKEVRELEKQVTQLKQKLATGAGADLTASAVDIAGVKVLGTIVDGADSSTLRQTLDHCKNKLGSGVVLLAAVEGDKISLVAGVTPDLVDRVKAGDVMREFAARVGGKGGGRPDMAQGGGTDVSALKPALGELASWVADRLT
ncbi:alanine--tRNA ligase [Luminiphilus sp.]|nr:alanine--tRNA ligase [Luminiphilus sp.]